MVFFPYSINCLIRILNNIFKTWHVLCCNIKISLIHNQYLKGFERMGKKGFWYVLLHISVWSITFEFDSMQISAQWLLKAEIFCDICYSIFLYRNWIKKYTIKSPNSQVNEIFLWNYVSSSNIAKHLNFDCFFSNQTSVVDLNFYYVHKETIKLYFNIKIKTEMAFNVFDMNFCGEFSKNVKSNGIHIE